MTRKNWVLPFGLAVECRGKPKPAVKGSLGQPVALIRYPPFVLNFVDDC
jgi:hypothetical protein